MFFNIFTFSTAFYPIFVLFSPTLEALGVVSAV